MGHTSSPLTRLRIQKCCSVAVCLLTICALVLATLAVASSSSNKCEDEYPDFINGNGEKPQIFLFGVGTLAHAIIACRVLPMATTIGFRRVALYVCILWLYTTSHVVWSSLWLLDVCHVARRLFDITQLLNFVVFVGMPAAVHTRLEILQTAMLEEIGMRSFDYLMSLAFVFGVVALAIRIFQQDDMIHGTTFFFIFSCLAWLGMTCYVLGSIVGARAFDTAQRLIKSMKVGWGEKASDDFAVAAFTAGRQAMSVRIGLWSSILGVLVQLLMFGGIWPFQCVQCDLHDQKEQIIVAFLGNLFLLGDLLCNAVALMVFTGVFSGALAAHMKKFRNEMCMFEKRQQKFASICGDTSGDADAHDTGWAAKVEDLAGRGVSLRALLTFYSGFAKVHMPHFDPSRSTTCDVVRHAIIPQSAAQQSALSTVLMEGKVTLPHRMVTHCWDNLFADLIAAVVADAIGDDEYDFARFALEDHLPRFIERLDLLGVLEKTYWICAFCVNQHASICGSNTHNRKDTVLDVQYPICNCGFPKFLNNTLPLRSDGKSVQCELNKFDDMMHYLAAQEPKFYQVIAVDRVFKLFTRAWCVAELAEAYDCGMQQKLKLPCMSSLEKHEKSLRQLDVEKMKASRPEDTQEILSKIPDKKAFNAKLQCLIFEDLLSNWRLMDLMEKVWKIGRIAHLGRHPDYSTWKSSMHTSTSSLHSQGAVCHQLMHVVEVAENIGMDIVHALMPGHREEGHAERDREEGHTERDIPGERVSPVNDCEVRSSELPLVTKLQDLANFIWVTDEIEFLQQDRSARGPSPRLEHEALPIP